MTSIATSNNNTNQDDYETANVESIGDKNIMNNDQSSDDKDSSSEEVIFNCVTPTTTRKRSIDVRHTCETLDEFNHQPHRHIQPIHQSLLEIGELQSIHLTNEQQRLLKHTKVRTFCG